MTLDAINRRSIAWELRKPENIQQISSKVKINKRASLASITEEAKR